MVVYCIFVIRALPGAIVSSSEAIALIGSIEKPEKDNIFNSLTRSTTSNITDHFDDKKRKLWFCCPVQPFGLITR